LLQAGSGRQVCLFVCLFPCSRHLFDEGEFLEESQRNITTCLLDTLCHVPPFRKNGQPPAAQIHRLSNVSSVVVLPFYISPVTDVFGRKQEQPAKHQQSRQGSSAVLTSSPDKNKVQED